MKTRVPMPAVTLVVLIMLVTACRTVPGASRQVKAQTLLFSLAGSEESSLFKGATRFADLIKQRTNGRLAISVSPRALLTTGDQVKELEMLQEGKIDFTYSSSTVYSNLDQRFSVMMLPWMFSSYADVDRILAGPQGHQVLQACDRLGIVGLALGENGFEQMTNSQREIKAPADVRGLKIGLRSANIDPSVFSELGATTRWLNASEAYRAMQSGIVDGQKNTIDQVVSNRLYEVQKYLTIWNYSYSTVILGVNKTVWASFDADMQEILREAAEEASAYQIQENRKATDAQLQLLKNKGMTVTVLSPDQIEAFKDLVPSAYVEYESVVGRQFVAQFAKENR